jgi:glycosyltransferase involved in cell wall biosynthesis
MKILHLLGATEDAGGILTVLRSIQGATPPSPGQHIVWVNAAFRETRAPALDYRHSHHLLDESTSPWRLVHGALRAMPELRRLVESETPDVLHVHTRGAFPLVALALRRLRVPWLVTFHCYARRVALYRWVTRLKHVMTTLLTPQMARHYRLPLDEGRVRIVSECCSDRLFEGTTVAPAGPPGPARPLRLIGLGSVIPEKNWHLILEALRTLPASERQCFEFHHHGPILAAPFSRNYAYDLHQIVRRHDLERVCTFHGPTLAVEEPLREADWFVLPSTNEPCSVALIEALALGLPALVAASGGNLDIVRPGRNGLLFAPDSAEALAASLQRIARGQAGVKSPTEIRSSVHARRASAVAADYGVIYRQLSATSLPGVPPVPCGSAQEP